MMIGERSMAAPAAARLGRATERGWSRWAANFAEWMAAARRSKNVVAFNDRTSGGHTSAEISLIGA
jgi:hypothetical protein